MRILLAAAAAALLLPAPARAQAESVAADAPDAARADPAPIDPARLAAAETIVAKVFPLGTYKKLMGDTMDRLMGSMMDGVMGMPLAQIAAMGGLEPDQAAALEEASLAEIMAIYDPHFRERTQVGMRAMMDSMAGLMTDYEPRIQAGLARAYARKFDAKQLADLNAFFATPTGRVYAAESMALYMDPEIMNEMQAFMPDMMKRMPDLVKAMTDATAHLPKPRKIEELSEAERAKLSRLLGVEENELRDPPAADLPGGEVAS